MKSVHIDTAKTWRGGQNQVLHLVNGLGELGHAAVLVAHDAGELKRRAQEGLRFVGFTPRSEFDVHAAWQLAKVFRDVQPDVIHAHDPMGIALTAMALQMRNGLTSTPLVVAARRVDFHLKRHAFSRWKHSRVDVFIAASRVIAGILVDDGIAEERIDVVHDGVNIGLVDKQPVVDAHATFWLPRGAPLVGNVAALAAHKGQKHLVTAAKAIVRHVPDARVLIVGEGELREPLERQIKELGLERHVLLTGFRADAIGLIKSFDVFVLCSVTEGLGSAMLEAMAAGKPVVATRAGGIPEAIVDGETGILVPPNDPESLASAITCLLNDPEHRERLAAAGRQRVIAEFSVERMVQNTLAVYQRRLSTVTT
jgi:glycosyltransferase involved in cell wall biosynthesis